MTSHTILHNMEGFVAELKLKAKPVDNVSTWPLVWEGEKVPPRNNVCLEVLLRLKQVGGLKCNVLKQVWIENGLWALSLAALFETVLHGPVARKWVNFNSELMVNSG